MVKDPDVRYTAGTQMAVANFTIAIDRYVKNGEKQTDFPRITVFGKQAENCEKFTGKGRLIAVQGRIQTRSYKNKAGETVYTTDVVADRVEFLEWGEKKGRSDDGPYDEENPYDSFAAVSEDVPF